MASIATATVGMDVPHSSVSGPCKARGNTDAEKRAATVEKLGGPQRAMGL